MTEKDRFYSEFEHVYNTAAIGQLACRETVLRLNITTFILQLLNIKIPITISDEIQLQTKIM